jgi:hypothetical protein
MVSLSSSAFPLATSFMVAANLQRQTQQGHPKLYELTWIFTLGFNPPPALKKIEDHQSLISYQLQSPPSVSSESHPLRKSGADWTVRPGSAKLGIS